MNLKRSAGKGCHPIIAAHAADGLDYLGVLMKQIYDAFESRRRQAMGAKKSSVTPANGSARVVLVT